MLPLIGIEPQEVKVKVNLRKKIWIDKKKAKNKKEAGLKIANELYICRSTGSEQTKDEVINF